jgi:hypothetical protein
MVQVLRASERQRRPGFTDVLGGVINAGMQAYGEHQKKKRFGEAIKGIEDTYADPNMSQEQKFVKSFSQLREFPELQKQFSSGLSQVSESPLQKAQRLKLEAETGELKGEQSYLDRLMSGEQNGEQPQHPGAEEMEAAEAPTQKGASTKPKVKYDPNDATTWSDKKINQLRSIEGKTSKAKTLARTAQNEYDARKETKTATKKYKEATAPFQGALETLNQMEKIGTRGNLGIGSKVKGIVSPTTRRDRAEYERLGKSLISFASNIPIRNRQEFETLAHDLYDPSISDDSRDGILAAMKRIIQNSVQQFEAPEGEEADQPRGASPSREKAQKERPSLTSFLR